MKIKQRKKEATMKIFQLKQSTKEVKGKLEKADKLSRIAVATYKSNLVALDTSDKSMQSYLKEGSARFIVKNLTKICLLQTCKVECIPMEECQICQYPVIVDVNWMNCTQRVEKIKSSVLPPVHTMCEVTKYFFIPIYTGDCEKDPSVADYRSRQMKEYMGTVSRASAIGSLIGSVIPGVGTAIGGMIGGKQVTANSIVSVTYFKEN